MDDVRVGVMGFGATSPLAGVANPELAVPAINRLTGDSVSVSVSASAVDGTSTPDSPIESSIRVVRGTGCWDLS